MERRQVTCRHGEPKISKAESSWCFLFAEYILDLEGSKPATWKCQRGQEKKKGSHKSLLSPAKDLKRGSRTRTEHFQMKTVLTVAKHHREAVAPIPPLLGKAKQELGCQPSLGCEANAECIM